MSIEIYPKIEQDLTELAVLKNMPVNKWQLLKPIHGLLPRAGSTNSTKSGVPGIIGRMNSALPWLIKCHSSMA